jgi:hypothetical protein
MSQKNPKLLKCRIVRMPQHSAEPTSRHQSLTHKQYLRIFAFSLVLGLIQISTIRYFNGFGVLFGQPVDRKLFVNLLGTMPNRNSHWQICIIQALTVDSPQ